MNFKLVFVLALALSMYEKVEAVSVFNLGLKVIGYIETHVDISHVTEETLDEVKEYLVESEVFQHLLSMMVENEMTEWDVMAIACTPQMAPIINELNEVLMPLELFPKIDRSQFC